MDIFKRHPVFWAFIVFILFTIPSSIDTYWDLYQKIRDVSMPSLNLGFWIWLLPSIGLVIAIIIILEGTLYKHQYFLEDAQDLYEQINELIRQLRDVAQVINKENEGKPNSYELLFEDKRYIDIINKMNKAREKCRDHKLDKWLGSVITLESKQAMFSINPYDINIAKFLDEAHQGARNYINTHFKRRENGKQ
jgi:hypothetical protein